MREALTELASVPVEQLVVETISTLVNVAYLRLGAVPGHEGAADARQARVAIDAIAALEPVTAPRLPPAAATELRQVLANLRLAFARATGQPDQPPAAPGPPPAPPPPERPRIWTPRGEV